ncbi:MAG: ribonuclease Z [Myxococcota bacterium]
MDPPELIVLGTSSQVPTRFRNHNGYLFRWWGEGLLFDPGEDTSGQMARMGVEPGSITQVFVTHFHGDHCLGLAGLFHSMAQAGVRHAVRVHFPEYGRPFFERALHACLYDDGMDVEVVPLPHDGSGTVDDTDPFAVITRPLSHSIETHGYRVQDPDGLSLAFVMDTRRCRGAEELARGADLLVCEATYLSSEEREARERGHMTAAHAAQLAHRAGCGELLLTHFSQRYPTTRQHLHEARSVFQPVTTAADLRRYPMPRRRGIMNSAASG